MHESVLVGYFCQLIGWLSRDALEKNEPGIETQHRLARAINLSHNPFDPAIGDILLQMDEGRGLPADFFIFELKRYWKRGIREELSKFTIKHQGVTLDKDFINALTKKHPKSLTAHFYGALIQSEKRGEPSTLCSAPYWRTLFPAEPPKPRPMLYHLHSMVFGTSVGKGMSFDELTNYIRDLNSQAASGSMASKGASRFALAYQDYKVYLFDAESLLEHRLVRERKQELQEESENEATRNYPRPF